MAGTFSATAADRKENYKHSMETELLKKKVKLCFLALVTFIGELLWFPYSKSIGFWKTTVTQPAWGHEMTD